MSLEVLENVDIKDYSTFSMGSRVAGFVSLRHEEDVPLALEEAAHRGLRVHVLGEGSNTIFATPAVSLPYLVLKMDMTGIEIVSEDSEHVVIRARAGHNWDDLVRFAVERGLSGIESLSAIPGSVGAAPVQNIGAYGQEVCDTLVEVRAFDTADKCFVSLSNSECLFAYRDSIFKNSQKGRYIISAVTLRLNKAMPSIPNYPDAIRYFEENGIASPSLSQIRDAIIDIRTKKLPNPAHEPNVGSYFKNAIVDAQTAASIAARFPAMPSFSLADGKVKIPTAWLVETAGLKGKSFGPVSVHTKHALVLIHDKSGSFSDLENAERQIIETVYGQFGIRIEREPNIVS